MKRVTFHGQRLAERLPIACQALRDIYRGDPITLEIENPEALREASAKLDAIRQQIERGER